MSKRTFVIADPHFGHGNICKFTRNDGTKLRHWDDVNDMDADMERMWNAVVAPGDRVYVMGDVVINRRSLPILARLNGRKALIKGNHDIFKLADYTPYFDDIRAYCVGQYEGRKYIISHIPLHPDSVGRFGINLHGHLHDGVVKDPRYVCVSAEQTGYVPILLQLALARAGHVEQ